jgi:hypothetical protein
MRLWDAACGAKELAFEWAASAAWSALVAQADDVGSEDAATLNAMMTSSADAQDAATLMVSPPAAPVYAGRAADKEHRCYDKPNL